MSSFVQYSRAEPGSISIKLAVYQRRKMFDVFLSATGIQPEDTVLDVGVTSDQTYGHSNYFEHWYPHKTRITASGVDDASFLEGISRLPARSLTTSTRARFWSMLVAGKDRPISFVRRGGSRARGYLSPRPIAGSRSSFTRSCPSRIGFPRLHSASYAK